MSILTLIVTAIGLSADAFAVSVGRAMKWRHFAWKPALALALTFGAFQALMPVLGWALGSAFADAIVEVDHWIAFGLLAMIGGKMIWESFRELRSDDDNAAERVSVPRIGISALLLLGLATSIDALAVGVSLALLGTSIVLAAVVIGVITGGISLLGVALGQRAGHRLSGSAELIGGAVLIAIGVKILIEHLGG
jgi:putative Mn2+ efflux pump MntP